MLNANLQLSPALKAWVMAQSGDAAAFVRSLIEQERQRQQRSEERNGHA